MCKGNGEIENQQWKYNKNDFRYSVESNYEIQKSDFFMEIHVQVE